MKKSCGVHALRIAVGITMLVLLLAGSAGATTITVNASGSGDYTMIQDAIDNASTGDTILVYSGIYYENVNVNKQLNLLGIGNPVVNARGSGSAITLSADGITLEGFTATRGSSYPEAGIKVTSSSNILNGNNASSNNYCGIFLSFSNNNTLNGSNASNNDIGIFLSSSGNNTISGNNASNNSYSGIYLSSSSNNKLSGNNASSNNNHGIYLSSSSNNKLSGNNASLNNNIGILMRLSSKNTLSGNKMAGNQYNFDSDGDTDSDFDNHIDTSNLVDGRSIYYIINVSDTTYDSSNAGTLYCISCVNVTIKNLNLNNNGKGIYFWNTSQSRIQNVNASKNRISIYLDYSSNNTLSDNNASSNNWNGIYLEYSNNNTLIGNNASSNNNHGIVLFSSGKNTIYNNIFNNTNNFYFYGSNINTWNTTRQPGNNIIGGSLLGGNFWANPNGTGFSQTCKDVNGDGICDSSRTLNANNIDYLPIIKYKIPPKSVSKLKNVSYASAYINWTWTDPKDADFDKVKIYINNIYRTSVMKGVQYYKAKNLYANRSYTISTRTVDKNGNLNLTWKNNTARTKPDLVPPMNVTNLKNITYGKNYINWTWKDPKDTDFKKVMVFIDDNFKENVSKGKCYYYATDFSANTKHTISTWTVDRNGNINKTWTNSSAWTAK